jgi:hypothetical protein
LPSFYALQILDGKCHQKFFRVFQVPLTVQKK